MSMSAVRTEEDEHSLDPAIISMFLQYFAATPLSLTKSIYLGYLGEEYVPSRLQTVLFVVAIIIYLRSILCVWTFCCTLHTTKASNSVSSPNCRHRCFTPNVQRPIYVL